jgi:purine-nucleoside phosphorylase
MTPHNNAKIDDYADVVLMPGDPKRAEFISSNFLENVKLVNHVRGCLGFTGFYKNKKVSVQASGMGQPSIGIYSHELFQTYNVKQIIRIGTCGSFQKDITVGDVIIATTSSSESSQIKDVIFSPTCDYELLFSVLSSFKNTKQRFHVGSIMSIDYFYHENKDWWKSLEALNVLGVDMETYILYFNAMKFKRAALTVDLVSDNLHGGYELSPDERVTNVSNMIETVLESL